MSISQGEVYFMASRRTPTSTKKHFYIVINPIGSMSKRVVLTICTSNFEMRLERAKLQNWHKDTIVQLSQESYGALDRLTVVDCNDARIEDLSTFGAEVLGRGVEKKPNIPQDVLNRIIHGIHLSPVPTDEIKQLIGPDPLAGTTPLSKQHGIKIKVSPSPAVS